MIVKTDKEDYSFFKFISLIFPKSFEEKIYEFFTAPSSMIENNIKKIKRPLTTTQIKKSVSNAVSLTIGTTQNCSLRCSYCVYGGKYSLRRSHSTKRMEYETYLQAIDFFFELINSPLRTNRSGISIGFYGGEPLLEFNNFYRCAEYAEKKLSLNNRKFPHTFMVTTNGLLLNKENIKKLVDKEFMIDISLDGPEEEHDKFRLKLDGSGSFKDVFSNIEYIKNKFPDFYSRKIRFYVTLHPFHNVLNLEKFFLSRPDLFNQKNVSFAWVSLRNLNKDLHRLWYQGNQNQAREIETELDKDKWVYKKLIKTWVLFLFNSPTQNIADKINFTGTCFPGNDRIFVDVDGNLHICERINDFFSIGNIHSGFDFKKIKKISNNWMKEILKMKCWECPAWWLCKCCYASRSTSNKFVLNKNECNRFVETSIKASKEFLSVLEAEDESKTADSYPDIDNYLDSL